MKFHCLTLTYIEDMFVEITNHVKCNNLDHRYETPQLNGINMF